MQQIFIYFFIAIGLSMDAFSLALAYGTNSLPLKKILFLSISVGIFHYFMPIVGSIVGNVFLTKFIEKANLIVSIIFLIIALEMYLSRNEEEKGTITNFLSILLFSFTVSIDSFSVGLGLGIMKNKISLAALIFALTSFGFTLLGLISGKKLSDRYGKNATYFGIIILIALAIDYLL